MAFRDNNARIKGEVMNKKLIGNTAWYFLGTVISATTGRTIENGKSGIELTSQNSLNTINKKDIY